MVSVEWFRTLLRLFRQPPVLARALLIPFLGIPVLLKLRLLRYFDLHFSWTLICRRSQFWRLLSPFFIAKLDINLIFDSLLRYQALSQLEFSVFSANDGAVFLCFGALFSILYAIADRASMELLTPVITMYIIYVWSMLNPELIIQFYFIPLKSRYFPWALLLINSLVFDKYFPAEFAGILIGNLYITLFKWSPRSKRFLESAFYGSKLKDLSAVLCRMRLRLKKQPVHANPVSDAAKRLEYFKNHLKPPGYTISEDNAAATMAPKAPVCDTK